MPLPKRILSSVSPKRWVFPKIGVPQNGWFIMEKSIYSSQWSFCSKFLADMQETQRSVVLMMLWLITRLYIHRVYCYVAMVSHAHMNLVKTHPLKLWGSAHIFPRFIISSLAWDRPYRHLTLKEEPLQHRNHNAKVEKFGVTIHPQVLNDKKNTRKFTGCSRRLGSEENGSIASLLDDKMSLFTHCAKLPRFKWKHHVRLTWNLQINLERNMIWTKHSWICEVWLMYNLPGCKVAILVSYPRNMNFPISSQEPKQKTTGIQYSSRASSIGVGIRRQDWKHHLLIGLT